ncbi:MAG: tyrosine-type recombinase/integrase [Flavobacteriales bacterium]
MKLEAFTDYLRTERRYSEHTVKAYLLDLEQFKAFIHRTFEIADAQDVTQPMVRSWLASLLEEGYETTSAHRKISSLQAFFRFLMRLRIVSSNPARHIPKPKKPIRLPQFVDVQGMKPIYSGETPIEDQQVDGFSKKRDQLIVTLLYETGIRRSEMVSLRDQDVDYSAGHIRVTGKRNKMRIVPISADMQQRIREYQLLRDQRFDAGSKQLLLTDRGKPITGSVVYLKVKSYLSEVTTIRRKSPHVLRHTFATHMLNQGADLNVIKEILGHASLAATQVYTHNSIEKLKGIHQRMHPRNKS